MYNCFGGGVVEPHSNPKKVKPYCQTDYEKLRYIGQSVG